MEVIAFQDAKIRLKKVIILAEVIMVVLVMEIAEENVLKDVTMLVKMAIIVIQQLLIVMILVQQIVTEKIGHNVMLAEAFAKEHVQESAVEDAVVLVKAHILVLIVVAEVALLVQTYVKADVLLSAQKLVQMIVLKIAPNLVPALLIQLNIKKERKIFK